MSAPSRSDRNPATTNPTVVGRSRRIYDTDVAEHMAWVERATRGDAEGYNMIRESIETHLTNIGTDAEPSRPPSTSNLRGAGPLDLLLAPPEFNGPASRIENATGLESPAERASIVDLVQRYIEMPALRARLREFYHGGYHGGSAARSGDRQGGNQHAGTVDGDGASYTNTGAESSSTMLTGTHVDPNPMAEDWNLIRQATQPGPEATELLTNTLRGYFTSARSRLPSEVPSLPMPLDFLTSSVHGVSDLADVRSRLLGAGTLFDGDTREEIEEQVMRGLSVRRQRERSGQSPSIYRVFVAWRQSEDDKWKVRPDHNGLGDDVEETPYAGTKPQGSWKKV